MPDNDSRGTADRRSFIKITGGAATVGMLGLAGCSSDDSNSGDNSGDGGDNSGDNSGETTTEEQSNYPNKEIAWINGGSAGGGFDQYTQALSKFLPKYLPNDVNIAVQTMGSWTQGNAKIYKGKSDGYTLGIVNVPGNIVTQVLQEPPWDLTEMAWFSRIARSVYTMGVAADGPHSSVKDLQNLDRPVKFATTGQGTSTLSTILGATALGIDLELVTGYAGSPEMVTGLLRGDADALQLPSTTTPMANAIKEGEIKPVLHYGEELSVILKENAPDVQTVVDIGEPQLEGQANLQRAVAAPPGTPDNIVSILEQATKETLQSDEFQSWAKEQGRPVDWAGADETSQAVKDSASFISDNKDVFDKYLG